MKMKSIDLFSLPPKVFISYSHADREFVTSLFNDLTRERINVWLDEREIKVGDSLIQKIESGINDSSFLVIILSSNSIASAWVREELKAALYLQLSEKKIVVLPVLLNDCEIPLFLRDKKYADFRKDYKSGLSSLLNAVAAPDFGMHGRNIQKDYHNDYSIDWLSLDDGNFGCKIEIMSHSPKLSFSVMASIMVTSNQGLSKRFTDFINAGFSWIIPDMLFIYIEDTIAKKPPIILIEKDLVANDRIDVIDSKNGSGVVINLEARRVGFNPGNDLLYEWGSIFSNIVDMHHKEVRRLIPQEEILRWGMWIKQNPIGNL